ncbi:hypothetical protein [Luteimonas kalidii]|uniref:Uncharacterized protein n=1 Tax=Luteimonas kalidii TaxID=3042025 RepID=A0ABT6JU64_9GAMM|nr:hypothetical protein [Luteimonas kalidii]MDH5834228.1 hypothetical protein [Luteimonas kalidii]
MTQNLLSLTLSDEDVAAVNAALSDLESRLTGLLALDNAARRQITKMGDNVMTQHFLHRSGR